MDSSDDFSDSLCQDDSDENGLVVDPCWIACPYCYKDIRDRYPEAARVWWNLSHTLMPCDVFTLSVDRHERLEELEEAGFILSCDVGESPMYELLTIYDDFVCVNADHTKIIWEMYESQSQA